MVQEADLMFHRSLKGQTHKEDPQLEVQEVFLSSQAIYIHKSLNMLISYNSLKNGS